MPVNDYLKFPLTWMPSKALLTYPYYLSLASILEHDIQSGKLAPGTKLPPQRALADYLDMNFTTITRAYDLCRERQLIYGVTGRGTFVAHQAHAERTTEVIELGVVLGFPEMTRTVVEAAREVLTRDALGNLFSYTNREGLEHQRIAGVQWMARSGITTDFEHTAIFAGAQNAITTALLSLFHIGDALATDTYTYANLIGAARLAHIHLVPIAGDKNGMVPEALHEACKMKKLKGIYLMPNCANPTTITMSEARRDAIADVCAQHQLIIIEDDAALIPGNHRSFYDRLPNQTIYIAAATRLIAPGLRITFSTFPEKYRKCMMQGLFLTNIKASALDAEIMSQLIISNKTDIILKEKRNMALQANQLYESIFPDTHNAGYNESLFRMLPISSTENGPDFEAHALDIGIRVCHSYRFAVEKNPKHAFLRVSLSSTKSIEQLKTGLILLKHTLA